MPSQWRKLRADIWSEASRAQNCTRLLRCCSAGNWRTGGDSPGAWSARIRPEKGRQASYRNYYWTLARSLRAGLQGVRYVTLRFQEVAS